MPRRLPAGSADVRGHEVVSRRGPSKPRVARSSNQEVAIRVVVRAPGMTGPEVAAYVREAVDNYQGQFEGDDPRRDIKTVEVLMRGWVDPDEQEGA